MRLLGSTAIIRVGMKRQRGDTCAQGLAAHHDTDRRPYRRIGARDVAHRDRPADAWPDPSGGSDADRGAVGRNDLRPLAGRRATVRPNAHALTVGPIRQLALNPPRARKAALDASALLN